MRLLVHLVAKDLKRKIRAPLGLSVALAFPVIFAGIIALAFGGGGDAVPKVRLLVDDEDGGLLANGLTSAFTSRQAAAYFDARAVDGAEGAALMEAGEASALLTIPKGFTQELVDGKPVTLHLLRNPSEGVLPEIAEQTVGAIADLLDGARRVLAGPIETLRSARKNEAAAPTDAEVTAIALAVKRTIEGSSSLLFPPVIALRSDLFDAGSTKAGAVPRPPGPSVFLLVLPGVAVYALFLVGDQAMRDVMTERTLGTLRRQLAGPVPVGTLVAAKALFTVVVSLAALVILAAIGSASLRTQVSVPGFVMLAGALTLAITGTASAIYGLCKTERQAATLSSIIYLAMAFAGGSFIRVDSLPRVLRAAAPLTPFYWGTQGFRALLENGAGPAALIPNLAVLATLGLALLAVGTAALRKSARAGL